MPFGCLFFGFFGFDFPAEFGVFGFAAFAFFVVDFFDRNRAAFAFIGFAVIRFAFAVFLADGRRTCCRHGQGHGMRRGGGGQQQQ
jgi:hypothetical protein